MPYNFAVESFHTKKLCSSLFFEKNPTFCRENEKIPLLRPLWGLGTTYTVYLRLIGKLIVDFLLVIIELFSLGALVLSQSTRLTDRQMLIEIPRLNSRSAIKTLLYCFDI